MKEFDEKYDEQQSTQTPFSQVTPLNKDGLNQRSAMGSGSDQDF